MTHSDAESVAPVVSKKFVGFAPPTDEDRKRADQLEATLLALVALIESDESHGYPGQSIEAFQLIVHAFEVTKNRNVQTWDFCTIRACVAGSLAMLRACDALADNQSIKATMILLEHAYKETLALDDRPFVWH